jgi:hypothetical protein
VNRAAAARFFAAVLLSLTAGWLSAAQSTEIISLRYASAEALVPALQPFLGADERVSAYGNQLVVRAAPDRIVELRRLVSDLDRRPVRLRISVANSGNNAFSERGTRTDARIGGGPVDIVVGDPTNGNQTRIIRRQTVSANDGIRQITANEGHPVFIHQGQSVPITTTTTNAWGQPVQQTQYRDVLSGFYATVRLSGDHATISVSTSDDRVSRSDAKSFEVRRSESVVSARLGEWVTIGTLGDAEQSRDGDIGRRTTTRREDEQRIRIMVERLD